MHQAQTREDQRKGQGLLFGGSAATPSAPTAAVAEWDEMERLAMEKEALGFYLSGHPFQKRGGFYSRLAGHTSSSLDGLPKGTEVRIAGMVASIRILQIKNGPNAGQKMARFNLEDLEGVVAVTCFAKKYQVIKDQLEEDALVFVTGRIDGEAEDAAILLDELQLAQSVVDTEVHSLVVCVQAEHVQDQILEQISDTIEGIEGDQRLLVQVVQEDEIFNVRTDARFKLRLTSVLLDRMADVVGPGNLGFVRR